MSEVPSKSHWKLGKIQIRNREILRVYQGVKVLHTLEIEDRRDHSGGGGGLLELHLLDERQQSKFSKEASGSRCFCETSIDSYRNVTVWWRCGDATLYQEEQVAAQALRIGASYARWAIIISMISGGNWCDF